jgi:hypothetical protein
VGAWLIALRVSSPHPSFGQLLLPKEVRRDKALDANESWKTCEKRGSRSSRETREQLIACDLEVGRDIVQYPGEPADAQRVVRRHRDVVLARRWWLGQSHVVSSLSRHRIAGARQPADAARRMPAKPA